jgi:DNA-binding NarL/FixJ family response regulator
MVSLPHPDPAPVRVLIVDDHPMVREGLRSMLEPAGVDIVGEAGTGEDALRMAAALGPDAILLDLELPDLDGLVVLQRLKALQRCSAVLIITMHDDPALVRHAVEGGASGYVLKGVGRRELLSALEAVRHGGSVFDPSLLRATLSAAPPSPRPTSLGKTAEPKTADGLTAIEQEMLRLVAQGLTNREIGARLRWSVGTVKKYLQRTLEKLGAADRTQAAVEAVKRGLLS